jgi:hypothetical protein
MNSMILEPHWEDGMRYRILGIALLMILAAPAAMAGIDVDYDESADFGKYRTYAWAEGTPAPLPATEKMIVAAIERELQAQGLRPAAGADADLYVISVTFADTTGGVTGGYYYSHSYHVGVVTSDVRVVTTGTLMIDLVDARENRIVWRAMAREIVKENRAKLGKKIDKVVGKMFRKYPGR